MIVVAAADELELISEYGADSENISRWGSDEGVMPKLVETLGSAITEAVF